MPHLRIRLSLVARFGTAVETVVATPYISAVLCFAVARFETAVETVKLSRFFRGALKFYEYVYCSVPVRNIGINRDCYAAHDIVLY